MDKLRPVDKQLKYQIEKLLKSSSASGSSGSTSEKANVGPSDNDEGSDEEESGEKGSTSGKGDLLAFRPRLSSLLNSGSGTSIGKGGKKKKGVDDDVADVDAELKKEQKRSATKSAGVLGKRKREDTDEVDNDEEEGDDVDVSRNGRAQLMGAAMFDSSERMLSKQERRQARMKEAMSSSRLVQELKAELSERPEEESSGGLGLVKMSKEDRERLEYEEDNYTRLLETKAMKKRRRLNEDVGRYDGFDDFADLTAISEMEEKKKKKEEASRAILEEMRRRNKTMGDNDDDDDEYGGGKGGMYSDDDVSDVYDDDDVDMYRQAQGKHAAKMAARGEGRIKRRGKDAPVYKAPKDRMVDDGEKRFAGNKILKNRGLVRCVLIVIHYYN